MDDDFRVRRRLEKAPAVHELTAQRARIGQVSVVADGEPARFKIGKQRLDVAEHRLAGRRIAVVANRGEALEAVDDLAVSEIVADEPKGAVIVKLLTVEANDSGRFLATMLERMQPQRRMGGRIAVAVDAKDPALFVEVIVFERVRPTHFVNPPGTTDGCRSAVPSRRVPFCYSRIFLLYQPISGPSP